MNIFESTFEKHKKLVLESRNGLIGEEASLTPAEIKQYKIKFGQMLKKDLGSFVKELQSAITDPKVQAFLMAAKEDGATDDDVIRIQQNEVPVLSLIPTQNEVFLEKSLNWPFNKQPENIVSYIRDAKGSMLPIIVSGNYVIDGHHRWSQIFCLNPKGVIPVYNITFEGKSDPTTILKKIHLGIAATRKELPTTGGQSTDTDLFKVAQDGFAKWIHANLDNNEAALKSFKIVEAEMKSKLQEADDAAAGNNVQFVSNVIIPYLWKNVLLIKQRPGEYERAIMPQTEKGGDGKLDTFINTMKSGNINVDPMTETLFESTFNKFKNLYTK
jgi:hypothetical protein